MTSGPGSAAVSGEDSVVLASFESYQAAEHMVASLGRGFREKARKGDVSAVVVRGNADGTLKVAKPRVLTGSDFVYALMRVSLSWVVGFLGVFSMFKGARSGVRAGEAHKGHVGSQEGRVAQEILADAGPGAAVVMVRCKDQQMRQMVAAAAKEHARASWDGPLAGFLAALDPGPDHDWVRAALGESSHTKR
jgi:hypothetical protein